MSLFRKYNLSEITAQGNFSTEMLEKIDLWNEMLQGKAQWNKESPSCGIIQCTIGELAKPVCEEIEITAKNEALEVPMQRLNECTHELVQNIVALGGSVVRPIYSDDKMQFEIIKLGNYIPTSYALDGTLTGCIITKKITDNKKEFLLIEKHKYENKAHTVESELYLIKGNSLTKVSLEECPQTAGTTPSYTWQNVEKPFIVEIRNRLPNNVDYSDIPCALWQNTENLVRNADEEYNRLNWELESGTTRVFADEDLFKKKKRKIAGQEVEEVAIEPKMNKMFVKLNGNGIDAERITVFNPALRTAQHKEAFNEILRRCELAWNIGKGTLSDLQAVQQTATQYTGGKKTLYSMVDSIESELEEKYKHLAYVFAYMLNVFQNVPFNDEIEISYNDVSRKDPVEMKKTAMLELQNGVISPAEYRMMFFGEDEETAKANVPEQVVSSDYGRFNFE